MDIKNISSLLNFKLTYRGVKRVLFSISITYIIIYSINTFTNMDLNGFFILSCSFIVFLITNTTEKLKSKIQYKRYVRQAVKDLGDEDLKYAYSCCINKNYLYISNLETVSNFHYKWENLLIVNTPQSVFLESEYIIVPYSQYASIKIIEEYDERNNKK